MKNRLFSVLMSGVLVFSAAACNTESTTTTTPAPVVDETTTSEAEETTASEVSSNGEAAEITLWTYPIGAWGQAETVDGIISNFNAKYPDIKVTVEYLDYQTGDDQVTAAIEANTKPDIIMEGPERLVTNWGAKGLMVDLADLWDEEAMADISATSEAVVNAAKWSDGKFYEYPMVMTTHTMAINKEAFEEAGAWDLIDHETRTWTTENFGKALQLLSDAGMNPIGIIYSGGQGGDQGTRALAMNLYSAKFANEDNTAWTMNSPEGVKGLQQLVDWHEAGIIGHDAGMVASDELQMFANGTAKMTFAWNASNEATYAAEVDFEPYAVAFPTDSGNPELAGGIWGFGIFNNEDENKIAAAKKFIEFVADDEEQGPESVKATGFFPVRASYGNVYAGEENEKRMEVFASFMPYMGDYYNVTPGWTEQRTAWWNMLQQIFTGTDVQEAADAYVEVATVN